MSNNNAQSYITDHLLTTKSLPVSQAWLTQFLSTQPVSSRPLSSLTRTALFRLLSSDFTKSLSSQNSAHLLPTDVADPVFKERRIVGPVPLQVLDIEDIGTSLWSQIEALERVERGEQLRGREIIRTVTRDPGGGDLDAVTNGGNSGLNAASTTTGDILGVSSNGPHRLVLEDAKGTKVVAIELKRINGIAVEKVPIGTKILLKNATLARGMILIEPANVEILGGKIDIMDKEWRAQRKARLLARLEQLQSDRS
ncbi:hypothetical protein VTO42DRAFT_3500 [Malbranchea cinnamomea]